MFEVNRGAGASWESGKGRVKWPFSGLSVGDEVVVRDKSMLTKAQAYAHTYAWRVGWKFETKTVNGALHVVRVA